MQKEFIAPRNHRGGDSGSNTQAVRAGNLILVGGQMSLDEQGRVVGSDIATQTRNALEALKRVLADAGAEMQDVVKHNIYFQCDGDDAEVTKFLDEIDRVRLDQARAQAPEHEALQTRAPTVTAGHHAVARR